MDLSKAYDCLPHELLIVTLGAYGLGRSSFKIIVMDYLNSCKKQTKAGTSCSKWSEIKHEILKVL